MGFLLRLLGSAAGPWILLVYFAAQIGAGVWTYRSGVNNGANAVKVAQAELVAKAVESARRAHEQDLKQRGWQDEREARTQREMSAGLQTRIADLMNTPPKVLIQTKVVPSESGNCAEPSLGNAFWLRYRAAGGGGSEADHGAAPAVPNGM